MALKLSASNVVYQTIFSKTKIAPQKPNFKEEDKKLRKHKKIRATFKLQFRTKKTFIFLTDLSFKTAFRHSKKESVKYLNEWI